MALTLRAWDVAMYPVFASYLRGEMGIGSRLSAFSFQKISESCELIAESFRSETLFLDPFHTIVRLGLAWPHVQPCPRKKQSLVVRRWPLAKAVANDQGRTTNDAFNLGAGNSRACSSGG